MRADEYRAISLDTLVINFESDFPLTREWLVDEFTTSYFFINGIEFVNVKYGSDFQNGKSYRVGFRLAAGIELCNVRCLLDDIARACNQSAVAGALRQEHGEFTFMVGSDPGKWAPFDLVFFAIDGEPLK